MRTPFKLALTAIVLIAAKVAMAATALEEASNRELAKAWVKNGYTTVNVWNDYYGPSKCKIERRDTYACVLGYFGGVNALDSQLTLRLRSEVNPRETIVADLGTVLVVKADREGEPTTTSKKAAFQATAAKLAQRRKNWNSVSLSDKDKANMKNFAISLIGRDPMKDGIFAARSMAYYVSAEDPFASILPNEVFKNTLSAKDSPSSVFGYLTQVLNGSLTVTSVAVGSPAFKAGLRQYDQILKINGTDAAKANSSENRKLVQKITALRHGATMQFSLDRSRVSTEKFQVSAVFWEGQNYLRLSLNTFMADEKMCVAIDKKIKSFKESFYPAGIVLDLRDNAGGSVQFARCLGTLFLGHDVLMATEVPLEKNLPKVEDRTYSQQQARSLGITPDTTTPLAVLMNGGSASASEILIGAFRDHRRAWNIGQLSFGKGSISVPEAFDKNRKFMVHKTGAIFYQPDGTSNELAGINPDFVVPSRLGASPDDDFRIRNRDQHPDLPYKKNDAVIPPRMNIAKSLLSCIDQRKLAASNKTMEAARVSADYQMLYSLEVLRCELLRTSQDPI